MSNLRISMKTPSHDLDKSPIDRAITALAACAFTEDRHGGLPGGPILDLTFLLSSKDDRPPFDGMRMGGYSTETQTLEPSFTPLGMTTLIFSVPKTCPVPPHVVQGLPL